MPLETTPRAPFAVFDNLTLSLTVEVEGCGGGGGGVTHRPGTPPTTLPRDVGPGRVPGRGLSPTIRVRHKTSRESILPGRYH